MLQHRTKALIFAGFLAIFIFVGSASAHNPQEQSNADDPYGLDVENLFFPIPASKAVVPRGKTQKATTGSVPLLPLLPPLWHTGDTHAHIQQCPISGVQPPDIPIDQLYQTQKTGEVQVTFAQIWGAYAGPIENFIDTYVPLVTGTEDPISVPDPDYIMQFGVEVSQFPSQKFGHIHGVGISDANFPFTATYPEPIIDFFHAQPDALTGYAHVFWPHSYDIGDIVFFPDQPLPHSVPVPYMPPIDAARGKIDFLETVNTNGNDQTQIDWRGIYYKLLNAGLRIPISSGRDNSCAGVGTDITFARIDSEPLTWSGWTDALKLGRTTLADGKLFLNMTVDGKEIGSTVYLSRPGTVMVDVSYTVAQNHTGNIRIIQDGVALSDSYPYTLAGGETATVSFPVEFTESGWVAAQADGTGMDAHTGPVYVIVGMQPVCEALDAGYWSDYATALTNNLPALVQDNILSLSPEEAAIVSGHIAEGKKVFEALKSCDLSLPTGISRYGLSTPSCEGPIQINAQGAPIEGGSFTITNINAPANASGWLVAGLGAANPPLLAKGAGLHIDPNTFLAILPVTATSGGYHEFPISLPSGTQGVTVYFQYFWQNTADCASVTSGLSASDAIAVTVQ